MKKIAFEEHFSTEEQLDSFRSILENKYPVSGVAEEEKTLAQEIPFYYPVKMQDKIDKLLDIGRGRIKEMDATGIDMQVLSLISPGIQVLDAAAGTAMARRVNEKLSAVVRKYPERFAGLACVAPQDPDEAAKELERAVKELGLKGVLINSHTKGEYLDDKKYWGILETAEKLGVPLYIHPRMPSPDMLSPYLAYPRLYSGVLGFSHEVSLHALRLIYSGVFDKYPDLKVILGHIGEAIPYWLGRMDKTWPPEVEFPNRPKKLPSEYFKSNFFVATSGVFWQPPLLCAYLTLGADRILFAVDYPIESNEQAVKFIDTAPISDCDKEKICHINAEKLLGL